MFQILEIHQTIRPVVIGTVMTALFILMCYLGTLSSIGFLVLPAATNVAAILLVIALFFALEREVGTLDRKGIAATLGKSLAASVPMGAIAYGAFWFVPADLPKIPLLLLFLFVFCVVCWVYYFLTRLFRMPETDYVARAMERRRGKR